MTDATTRGRIGIYLRALTLLRDYPFTGSGLGTFWMVLSSYGLLLHVGFTSHAHNTFLQLAIQQGLPGLLAFVWLVAALFWQAGRGTSQGAQGGSPPGGGYQLSAIGQAALWSVVAILVHGMIDAPLVTGRLLPVLFVPFGLAAMDGALDKRAGAPAANRGPADRRRRWAAGLSLVVVVLVAGLLWRRPLLSLLFSNLGTVHQTWTELSVYEWREWKIQDVVRREKDLSRPVAELQRALLYDPGNGAANRRLGMIELSLGEYADALEHLTAAYETESGSETTRQLLGEALIVNGQPDAGRALWSAVSNDRGQLGLRAWWYGHIGDEQTAAWMKEAVADR